MQSVASRHIQLTKSYAKTLNPEDLNVPALARDAGGSSRPPTCSDRS